MKWFSSDWHLNHDLLIKNGQRKFSSVEEMNNTIIENMTSIPKKGDMFYFLGDIGTDLEIIEKALKEFAKKKIRFIWIIGNHDQRFIKQLEGKIKQYSKYNAIYPMFETRLTDKDYKHYSTTLCHYPMLTWNKSHYNSFQLYGHHHTTTWKHEEMAAFELTGKKLNVCCEFHDYKPISELEVIEIMKTRPDNWDLIKK